MVLISRLYIILGNGFSIDSMNRLGLNNQIDLRNLFSKGAQVPWPGSDSNGFLSHKHCRALWTLGARTTMSREQSNKLIEDIITCANVYNYSRQNNLDIKEQGGIKDNLYIEAYGELTTYLRYLIIYYDSIIKQQELSKVQIPLINYIKRGLVKYDEIVIINYNYDIIFERLLIAHDLAFNIEGFQNQEDSKIRIIKPHGSISFSFNVKISGPFSIRNFGFDEISQEISNFDIKYDYKDDFPIVNAIIPPAGDSNRFQMGWIKTLRNSINKRLSMSESKDKLIIYGISYWHVDRVEIDEILTKFNPKIDAILINPNPPTCLDAVLTSIYQNYIHYENSDLLEGSSCE